MHTLVRIHLGCVAQARGAGTREKAYVSERSHHKAFFFFLTTVTSFLPQFQLQSKCGHRPISDDFTAGSSSAVARIPALLCHLLPRPKRALYVLRHTFASLL